MAITNTWSVTSMTRVDADGGVIKAYWSCGAASSYASGLANQAEINELMQRNVDHQILKPRMLLL